MTADFRLFIRSNGGPEVIEREEITAPTPAADEVVIRHDAIGRNFIDTYHRSGLYPMPLPAGLGGEGAGVVEATGADVTDLRVGQRVAYGGGPRGSYATVRAIPAEHVVPLPDTIEARTAAAVMIKGYTADMLAGPCGKVEAGQTVLVHAASGGVGSLLVPWLAAIGARVIAHAGTPEKAARAQRLGADVALSCPLDHLAEAVRAATGGRGADTIFDGVGKASWDASLASLARRGLMVSFGNASGAVPPVEPLALTRAGSVFLTRPTTGDYFTNAQERRTAAARIFTRIVDGTLPIEIGQTFALADAADAHRAIESRGTIGSTILLP